MERIEDLEVEKIDKRREKRKKSEWLRAIESVFDGYTLKALYDLIDFGSEEIKGMDFRGVISSGKEANVYYALSPKGEELAIKIYRTVAVEFKRMEAYISGDPRFKKRRKSTHALIYDWARKEFANLTKMEEVGVRVPRSIELKRNVLVMEFIGEDGLAAPLLKDSPPETYEEAEKLFKTLIGFVKTLYNKASLVHADLSEWNIMMFNGPVIIDVSQSVLKLHPNAEIFLLRDLKNLLRYFSHLGLEDLPSLEELYEEITGNRPSEKDLVEV